MASNGQTLVVGDLLQQGRRTVGLAVVKTYAGGAPIIVGNDLWSWMIDARLFGWFKSPTWSRRHSGADGTMVGYSSLRWMEVSRGAVGTR